MDLSSPHTAFVTGGASGLGLATARELHEAGCQVCLVDLPGSEGSARAEELGERALFAPADVTDPDQVQAALDAAVDRFGGVDIVVNCAGIGWAQRTAGKEAHDLGAFHKVVEVNLVGTFNVIRLAAQHMIDREHDTGDDDRGVIVSTASIAAFDGQIGQVAYAASKGGVVGMTLPIARDLARHAIRNVTIAPGLMDTPMLAGLPEPTRAALAENVPYPGRLGDPAEYGALVRHIVENRYLNGSVIRFDAALRMPPK